MIERPDADIEIERDADCVKARGLTEAGEEFLDAYTAIDLDVLDAGHIAVPHEGAWALTTRAKEAGLTVGVVA